MKLPDFKSFIVFENDNYLLVNKPSSLSTLADRNDKLNLQALAQDYLPSSQIGHRLDKETSGILAIAKSPEAYRHLAIQFENRLVTKLYHAVVDGTQELKEHKVNVPIYVLGSGGVKIDSRRGKSSKTIFNTLEIYRRHSLVACEPITGRMHQIRVHLSFSKLPIVGDELYRGKPLFLSSLKKNYNLKKWTDEQPLIKRIALHAQKLSFKDLGGEMITAEAPYPKDFAALVKQLRKFR